MSKWEYSDANASIPPAQVIFRPTSVVLSATHSGSSPRHHHHLWNPSFSTLRAQTPLKPSTASLPFCTLSEQVLAGANSGPILWNPSKPKTHSVSTLRTQSKILSSSNATPIFPGKPTASYIPVCTISEPAPSPTRINPQNPPPITGQTLAIITVCAIAIPLYKVLLSQFHVLSLKCSGTLPDVGGGAKPFSLDLFYAGSGKKDARSAGISAGVATLIKIYALVLAGRVLLNFIPNVPWEKQPMAALSQVTDPYLHIFQNTAPLVLFSLDVSPILPFVLLGVLGLLVKLP